MTVGTQKTKRLTHVGGDGRAQMVDVSAKPMSKRRAVAIGKIRLQRETLDLIAKDQVAKGNVFATARIAGIKLQSKLRSSFRSATLCRLAKFKSRLPLRTRAQR